MDINTAIKALSVMGRSLQPYEREAIAIVRAFAVEALDLQLRASIRFTNETRAATSNTQAPHQSYDEILNSEYAALSQGNIAPPSAALSIITPRVWVGYPSRMPYRKNATSHTK